MSIIIRIDLYVGKPEVEEYGKVFNARDPAEAKQFVMLSQPSQLGGSLHTMRLWGNLTAH